MSKKRRPFPTCSQALGKLIEDVPADNVRTYDVSSFPGGVEVFPEATRQRPRRLERRRASGGTVETRRIGLRPRLPARSGAVASRHGRGSLGRGG